MVEVGPAQKWNGGKVLRGEIEELMGRAGIALERLVCTVTGVVCGLAAADNWLAARVSNLVFIKRAVVGEVCKWGSGLLKSRLCFLTSKNHKQDYKQRGTTTWG